MTDARDALRQLLDLVRDEVANHCSGDGGPCDCPLCGFDFAALAEMDAPAEARCWTEDYEEENGQYAHRCRSCQGQFLGHKHRENLCKLCAPRGKCGTCGGSGKVQPTGGRFERWQPCPECAAEEARP